MPATITATTTAITARVFSIDASEQYLTNRLSVKRLATFCQLPAKPLKSNVAEKQARKVLMTDITTGRPATLAPNGLVTSPHTLASQAGVDVLRAGGSAIDAAVAASAVLSVVYPHMTSIGGDAFWLIYDAGSRGVRYVDGGGRATASGTIDAFKKRGLSEVPVKGVLPATLTVPGAVASWGEAHAAYGRLPLKRCLESAIGYARDGFPVTARLAYWRSLAREELAKSPEAAAIFLKDGAILRNPDLARTLEAIASDGWYGFYDG